MEQGAAETERSQDRAELDDREREGIGAESLDLQESGEDDRATQEDDHGNQIGGHSPADGTQGALHQGLGRI